jgi:hypothetical protein
VGLLDRWTLSPTVLDVRSADQYVRQLNLRAV